MKVYIISGMAAALAGMIITARLGSGSLPTRAKALNCRSLLPVVLGSTSLLAASERIGTLLGALSIAVIRTG
ncbi:hypothetical protein MJ584_14085 [Klebsiella pneumoniae]|nr:hypothetical protein MJ584_14085 [Klebsiella pneumoniae]